MITRRPLNQSAARPPLSSASKECNSLIKSQISGNLVIPKINLHSVEEEREYETIAYRKRWTSYLLAIAYICDPSVPKEELNNLIYKLESGAINLLCCNTNSIPRNLREIYNKDILIKLIRRGFSLSEDEVNSSQKIRKLITLFSDEPDIEFAFELLIRSLMIDTTKSVVNDNSVDFLGNELDLLKDYNVGFEYKLLKIASLCFKLKIEIVYIHEAG
jgi:hypothetical protein